MGTQTKPKFNTRAQELLRSLLPLPDQSKTVTVDEIPEWRNLQNLGFVRTWVLHGQHANQWGVKITQAGRTALHNAALESYLEEQRADQASDR